MAIARQFFTPSDSPSFTLWAGGGGTNQPRAHPRYWLDARTSHALSDRGRQTAFKAPRKLAWRGMASDATPGRPAPYTFHRRSDLKESKNISILFERITAALGGAPWEMIVVDDDFPDGTSDVAFGLAARDNRLRCLRRVNRSGLAGAVIEGWMSSSADLLRSSTAIFSTTNPSFLRCTRPLPKAGDLVIGTRLRDASEGALSPARQRFSDLGAWFFRRIAGAPVSDPMSGFFMIRREIVSRLAPRLSPDGFRSWSTLFFRRAAN